MKLKEPNHDGEEGPLLNGGGDGDRRGTSTDDISKAAPEVTSDHHRRGATPVRQREPTLNPRDHEDTRGAKHRWSDQQSAPYSPQAPVLWFHTRQWLNVSLPTPRTATQPGLGNV